MLTKRVYRHLVTSKVQCASQPDASNGGNSQSTARPAAFLVLTVQSEKQPAVMGEHGPNTAQEGKGVAGPRWETYRVNASQSSNWQLLTCDSTSQSLVMFFWEVLGTLGAGWSPCGHIPGFLHSAPLSTTMWTEQFWLSPWQSQLTEMMNKEPLCHAFPSMRVRTLKGEQNKSFLF